MSFFNTPFFSIYDTTDGDIDLINKILGSRGYRRQNRLGDGGNKGGQVAVRSRHNLLDNWFNDDLINRDHIIPPVDIVDRKDEYVLHVTCPGVVSLDNMDLEYHQNLNQVVVSGEIPSKIVDEEADNVKVQERASGSFKRVVTLPENPRVDADKMKASYKNGVLTLTIPKVFSSEQEKVKKIKISGEE